MVRQPVWVRTRIVRWVGRNFPLSAYERPACDAPEAHVCSFVLHSTSQTPLAASCMCDSQRRMRLRGLDGGIGESSGTRWAGRLAKHPPFAARHVVQQLVAAYPVEGRMRGHAALSIEAARWLSIPRLRRLGGIGRGRSAVRRAGRLAKHS